MSCKQTGWCAPMIIYLAISVIGMIGIFKQGEKPLRNIMISLLWVLFWTFVMYELCRNCQTGWAWLILLFPVIVWAVIAMIIVAGLAETVGACRIPGKGCVTAIDKSDCDTLGGVFAKGEMCSAQQAQSQQPTRSVVVRTVPVTVVRTPYYNYGTYGGGFGGGFGGYGGRRDDRDRRGGRGDRDRR